MESLHHFIFIDIVGLSNPALSTERQVKKIEILTNTIKSCKSFKNTPENKRIAIPTGDGAAIGFEEINLPLDLAIEIHKKLNKYNLKKQWLDKILLHIGIHSQHVLPFTDLNGERNVWGDGIIIAQRIMSKSPPGFILLSEEIGKELVKSKKYKKIVYHAGNIQLKYQKQFVWYAYDDDFGRNDISEIEDLNEQFSEFSAEILEKKHFRLGETIRVKVDFTGKLTSGFYNVMLRAPKGSMFPRGRPNMWFPSPETFDALHGGGKLCGDVAKISVWGFCIESDYPTGVYTVYIRVYDQLERGQMPVIREKMETIHITKE